MEWSDDVILMFIQEIENLPVLWDNTDPYFKVIRKKTEAWESLGEKFGRNSNDVKKKWLSLLASYRRERCKERDGPKWTRNRRPSTWYAYKAMDFFGRRYKPRTAIKSEIIHIQNAECDGDSTNDDEKEEAIEVVRREDNDVTIFADPLSLTQPSKRTTHFSSNPLPRNNVQEDARTNEVCDIIRTSTSKNENERDEFVIYAEYVASKLRKLDSHSSTVAQHYINKVLFEAELGRYKDSFPDVSH